LAETAADVFKRLVAAKPPGHRTFQLDTACVLGGSIAGLIAARVLADHARHVVIFERDVVNEEGRSRAGVPQDQQLHVLTSGLTWLERWLPGFTEEMLDRGAELAEPGEFVQYLDGSRQRPVRDHRMISASRPMIESRVRARVLALTNVLAVQARATGLEFHDGRVCAVLGDSGGAVGTLQTDIVVDAMGRASKLSDWLTRGGYDRPPLHRLATGINYASALFKRLPRRDGQAVTTAARFGPPYPADGVAVAAATAVENDQWLVTLMGYDDSGPGRTLKAFQKTCQKLPPVFAEAAADPATGEIMTYHQADSRRRDFADVRNFPAGLVSVGDAVASFNPIYGQGMSSAALHGSCLSEYLLPEPDLGRPATAFFDLQKIVVDAAWTISAGGDAARLDALNGTEVPAEVGRQRWALDQLIQATVTDDVVASKVNDVSFMVAHPDTLADPALLERAVIANKQCSR
jgi:2-polyprenyl-6-methoxyphenol hydroxylase-like FAD-dependent oxidoreductase